MQHRAKDVEDVAKEPDDNEEEGEAGGGVAPEVFEDLGREYYDPAGY